MYKSLSLESGPGWLLHVIGLSVKGGTFTSGHNLKPPFLRQKLGFFFNFLQKLDITLWPLLCLQNPNFKKIVDLKVYW